MMDVLKFFLKTISAILIFMFLLAVISGDEYKVAMQILGFAAISLSITLAITVFTITLGKRGKKNEI